MKICNECHMRAANVIYTGIYWALRQMLSCSATPPPSSYVAKCNIGHSALVTRLQQVSLGCDTQQHSRQVCDVVCSRGRGFTWMLKPALLSHMTMPSNSKSWMSTGVVLPNLMALLLLRTRDRRTTTFEVACMPGVLLMHTPSSATLNNESDTVTLLSVRVRMLMETTRFARNNRQVVTCG